jgi:Protein of unknown function (DUF3052)
MANSATAASRTPLAKRLGIREGFRIRLVNPPANYFDLLQDAPAGLVVLADKRANKDFIHLFVTEAKALCAQLASLKTEIEPNGAIWVSWPKRAAKIGVDLSDDVVRKAALEAGLVDVKVCSVDDVWSGLKLVIPLRDRR